jgi:hypothetical protein
MSARPPRANRGILVLAVITASVLSELPAGHVALCHADSLHDRVHEAALNLSFWTRPSMRAESVLRRGTRQLVRLAHSSRAPTMTGRPVGCMQIAPGKP